MDLGDGLLFVLEKGKPKLILLNSGEKVQKNPVKLRPKLPSVLSCRQPSRLETHTPRTEAPPSRKLMAPNGRSRQSKAGRGWGQTVTTSRTQENHAPGKEFQTKARVKSAKPQNVQRPIGKPEEPKKKAGQNAEPSNQSTTPPDSGVRLTDEQLQRTLNVAPANDSPPNAEGIQAACVPEFVSSERKESEETREETATGNALNRDRSSGGLLRWLEERPSKDRAALEAKKAQYKKELDEQVALKQEIQRALPHRLQEDDAESLVSVQSSVSYKDLPAAIRSSIRVGDFTPMDELVQEQGQEQRRRWLQELDKQRKDFSERKRLEKLQRRQPTEDQHPWTSHFDSLQRPPLAPLPCSLPPLPRPLCPSADPGETGPPSRASHWDEASARASVETTTSSSSSGGGGGGGRGTRASHLRTMTSLLDPAEIEERERRRLKQLEQQRAIERQMEERRRRREEEESLRKREEEEEERRVEQERRRMQRQYEIDSQRERYKEQTPEPEPESESEPQSNTANGDERPEQEAGSTPVNHHRDTGVQTEEVHISESFGPDACGPPVSGPSVVDRAQVLHMLQMLHKGFGSDVYGPFARTDHSRTDHSRTDHSRMDHSRRDEKRPEWNTQRPSRRFVPASQRYPEELQRQRQESRLRRQAQLLSLQRNLNHNNNTTANDKDDDNELATAGQNPRPDLNPDLNPDLSPTERSGAEARRATGRVETFGQTSDGGRSPVRGQSPAPDFLPYVRTDEVFSLKPVETQHAAPAPQLLQKTQRQQDIIRGLAQLRQGLLQKQRELESDLSRGRLDNGIRPANPPT